MSIESRSHQYGKVFGHWQIKEFLGSGSGGKSAVFRLTRSDSAWGTSALKVINLMEERGSFEGLSTFRKSEYLAACEDCSSKAEQEVRLMDDLQGNTNIVDYLDHTFVDWSDEFGFGRDMLIRMELLKDLRGVIQKGHVFSEAEVLKVGKDICTALVLCHRKNILHRDIKLENIFVNKDGNFKLGDFGVSRILSAAPMAMASTGIGTPEYAAPEQFTGHHDKRVDIYSLGLVLYELGNQNRLPFADSTYARQEDIRRRHMGEPLPAPCNVGDDFAKVILKACAHRAEDRYQTASEFLKALNSVAKRLVSERAETPKRENAKPAMKAEPTRSGFETQKAVYDEYMTAPAKPNQEEPAFDWDAYSTMMAKVEEPADYFTQPEENTYQSAGQTEPKTQPKRRKNQVVYVALIVGVTLLLMFVTGTLLAYIIGAAPEKKNGEAQTELQTVASTEDVTELTTAESVEATTLTLPTEEETVPAATEANWQFTYVPQKLQQYRTIAAGDDFTVGLKSDGTVIATGRNFVGQCDVSDWENIVSISAGNAHTVGLKSDGTVVAVGLKRDGQCDVDDWNGIVAIAAGGLHTVGLKSDGTVVAVGYNYYGQCEVESWTDIIAIAASYGHTVGLKSDGTVVTAGPNWEKKCDVKDWHDIVAIEASFDWTLGLKSDGTVVCTQQGTYFDNWTDIVSVSKNLGLKSDGTVVGPNGGKTFGWSDLAAIDSAGSYTIGLKLDGTVISTGVNQFGAGNVDGWSGIRLPGEVEVDPQTYPKPERNYIYTGVVVNTDSLKIRDGVGISQTVVGTFRRGTKVKIYETVVSGGTQWGRCDKGWICLDYVQLTPNIT